MKHILLAGLLALALVACSSTETPDPNAKPADPAAHPTPDMPKDPTPDTPKDPTPDTPKDPTPDMPKDPTPDTPADPPKDPPVDPPVDPGMGDAAVDALAGELIDAVGKYRSEFDELSNSLESSSDMAATLSDFAGKWQGWASEVEGKLGAHQDNEKLSGWASKLSDLKAALASAKEQAGADPKAALAALDVWK